jgi:hypothetical protein
MTFMKKRFLFLFIFTAFFASCRTAKEQNEKEVYLFTSFREPATDGLRLLYSYDGYGWDSLPGIFLKPEVGVQQLMRDPSIVAGADGTFHLVWTCSWKGDPAFGYASSNDLIAWSEQQYIPIMAFDATTINVWAPELFYDDANNDFIIVWASTVPFKFEKGIEAEDNNHRLYYTRTKDFKDFSKAELLYDPGYSSIDAVIVKRDSADYVLVFKDNTRPERNMRVAFGRAAVGPYGDPSEKFTDRLTEGPSVVRIGDEWLIYFDAYGRKSYNAVSTKDFKTFTDINDKISIPEGHKHGTIFKAPESILKALREK